MAEVLRNTYRGLNSDGDVIVLDPGTSISEVANQEDVERLRELNGIVEEEEEATGGEEPPPEEEEASGSGTVDLT